MKTMMEILKEYKGGKEVDPNDLSILKELAMTGYIRLGYKFNRTTFLVTPTARITSMGLDILSHSHSVATTLC
jgi:hypothetical protein